MKENTDLFIKPKSKKEQVYEFIKQRQWVKTHEAIEFGLSIYTNRGDRYCRDLAEEGKIKRMDKDLKKLRFGDTKEDVWELV